jgi:hypothetical protein
MEISLVTKYDQQLLDTVNDLFPDIVEDGTPYTAIDGYVNIKTSAWFRLSHAGELVGFVELRPFNRSVLEIHPFIRKCMRNHSEKAVKLVLDWFDSDAPEMYQSIITNIPACKRYATIFAHRMKFKRAGAISKGFYKNGVYHDMLFFQRGRNHG